MGIRIPCLIDDQWTSEEGYIDPPRHPIEVTLCRFSDGVPESSEKTALRILASLKVSAAVYEQMAVYMVQEILQGITAEGGYSRREVAEAEKVLLFLEHHTVCDRRGGK